MRHLGNALLILGLLVAVAGGAGLVAGLHVTGLAWLITIGLAKLTLLASGGLMAGGQSFYESRDATRAERSSTPAMIECSLPGYRTI